MAAAAKLGTITCPFCGTAGCAVRENKAGRLYYMCPDCYQVQPHGPGFQAFVMSRGTLGESDPPPPPPPPPAKPATKPGKAAPAAKKRGFMAALIHDDEGEE